MALTERIKPINEKHSIKEAVLSLFLPSPLIKPERFESLLKAPGFKDKFQHFENVSTISVEIKGSKGTILSNTSNMQNVGFKFTSFSKGKVDTVLQGINQDRFFISYHSRNYTRWQDFFSGFKTVMDFLSQAEPNLFIKAYSLHYIDEFFWIDPGPIDLKVLFQQNSRYIPQEFFESERTQYQITTEKKVPSGDMVFDRMEIQVEPRAVPLIRISHNLTQPLTDFFSLTQVMDQEFYPKFQAVHHKNKAMLKDLLNKDVCELIGITS
jgi:uncharacterized protein (TIGR04255 family)